MLMMLAVLLGLLSGLLGAGETRPHKAGSLLSLLSRTPWGW